MDPELSAGLLDLQALMDARLTSDKPGGRLVVISFPLPGHRLVKTLCGRRQAGIFEVLTKKPLTATEERSIAIRDRAAEAAGRGTQMSLASPGRVGQGEAKVPGRRRLPFCTWANYLPTNGSAPE